MDLKTLESVAASCTNCNLHEGRINPVFAKGNPEASIMICGMVPADEENKAGLPFVGRAGQLLDKILNDTGLSLNDVYITNLVKCYLAAGLPLQKSWIDSCFSYLIAQIGLIKPRVIITLGKDASISLLGIENNMSLGKIKGRIFGYGEGIFVLPTYHPSYLLRGGGEFHKSYSSVVSDFLKAKEIGVNF